MTALLEAKALTAGYQGVPVVHGIDLEVHAGEVVALLGPNGAGKSTTILALSGDLKPMDGEVHVNGAMVKAPLHRRVRQGLSLVTEERSVIMGLTARENLALGRGPIDLAIDLFPDLEPHLDRRASSRF